LNSKKKANNQSKLPKGRSARSKQFMLLPRHVHDTQAPEERMMLDALLPEALTVVAIVKVKLNSVLVEAVVLRVQLHQKLLTPEAELANLGPAERVDFCEVLKHQNAHVRYRQIELDAFVVFGRMHDYTVELNLARYVQKIQVRIGRSLTSINIELSNHVLLCL